MLLLLLLLLLLLTVQAGIASGAASFGLSPNFDTEEHLIFELKFEARPGGFTVQFKDPGV